MIDRLWCPLVSLLFAWTRCIFMHQPVNPGAMQSHKGSARPGAIHGLHLGKRGMFT